MEISADQFVALVRLADEAERARDFLMHPNHQDGVWRANFQLKAMAECAERINSAMKAVESSLPKREP